MDAFRRGSLQFLVLIGAITGSVACNQQVKVADASAQCTGQAIPQSFLVKWNGDVPAEYAQYKVSPVSKITRFSGMIQQDVEKKILQKYPTQVIVAEHEFRVQSIDGENALQAPPPAVKALASNAWGLADANISGAWSFTGKKGDGIVVAVIDSGIDVNHPALSTQLWTNPRTNADGLSNDTHGYNFANQNGDLTDGLGHGTHVSGIIAGLPDQTSGFQGVAPNSKIMALKFMDAAGNGSVGNAISAVEYASTSGAKVINASWGGDQCSAILQQEIINATQGGAVFVNAAGNSSVDISRSPEYPAVYQIPGKITVASSNINDVLSSFSNYGVLVDLAAPGESILSTIPPAAGQPEGQMTYKSGTSMAAPFVAGVAALLYAAKPSASVDEIVAAINGGIDLGHYGVRTQGKLNALKAAQYLMSH